MFFFFPDSQNQDLFIKMIGDTETFEKEEKIEKVEETKKKEETSLCSQSQNTEKQDEIAVHDARIKLNAWPLVDYCSHRSYTLPGYWKKCSA